MKIYSNRSCFMIVVLLSFTVAVNAQAVDKIQNTKERVSDQLKKGTVPGLKFAPVTTMLLPRKEDSKEETENTIKNMKSNIGPNMKTAQSTGGNSVSNQINKTNSTLASDKVPDLVRKDSVTVKPYIPTQETAQESSQKKQ